MYPHRSVAPVATPVREPKTRTNRSNGRPRRSMPLMRKYEVAHLTPNGEISEFSQIAPSLPVFEEAFAAIARGALFKTQNGMVAIEDLLPGDQVQTANNGFQTILWKGNTAIVPETMTGPHGQATEMGQLTRITADSFGLGRPMPDLLLGPKARIVVRSRKSGEVLTPVTEMQNGDTVFSVTPFTPVQAYHLAFESHQILRVNGLDIESYHPGNGVEMSLSREMLPLFLGLFPHCKTIDDFGPMCLQRISGDDLVENTSPNFAA